MKKFKELLPIYVKGLVSHKYTLRQASESTGYSIRQLSEIKRRFLVEGDAVFEHGNKARIPHNKTSKAKAEKIILIYESEYSDCNFKFFAECLRLYEGIEIHYNTLRHIMAEYGIHSPNQHKVTKKTKKAHKPRPRRQNEGDLLQIDGTPFQWFAWNGDNAYYCLSGAIDDATNKITGLYMTENECLYGYLAVLRQTVRNYGVQREIYSDRAAIFAVAPKDKNNLTIIEQLQGLHENRTQFQRILNELRIRQILAWTPQAKGRVERMWGTIQGQLPVLFRKFKIKNMAEANKFIQDVYIPLFNSHSVAPARSDSFFLPTDKKIEDVLCCRISKRTNRNGTFKFHDYEFTIESRYPCNQYIDICITENEIYGELMEIETRGKETIRNKIERVELRLLDFLTDGRGEKAPIVVRNIIYDYMLAEAKEVSA